MEYAPRISTFVFGIERAIRPETTKDWYCYQSLPLAYVGAQVASLHCPILHRKQNKYTIPLFQGVKISGFGAEPHHKNSFWLALANQKLPCFYSSCSGDIMPALGANRCAKVTKPPSLSLGGGMRRWLCWSRLDGDKVIIATPCLIVNNIGSDKGAVCVYRP